ncbi:PDZ domain-containing protein [Acidobacteriota bacterium]
MNQKRALQIIVISILVLYIPALSGDSFGMENGKFSVGKHTPSDTASSLLSIPFTFDGRIIIPLKINNSKNIDVILDTGVGQSLLLIMHEESGSELGLEYTDTRDIIRGAGSGKNKAAHLSPEVNVSLSNIDLGPIFTAVIAESRTVSSHHNTGVIGGAIFSSFVTEIDFDSMKLNLYDPESFKPDEGWEGIPITLERNMPIIETSIFNDGGEDIPVKLLVDTGAQPILGLVPEKNAGIKREGRFVHTLSGTGLRGDTFANTARLFALRIGPHRLTDLLSDYLELEDFPAMKELPCDGLVGIGTLYRYNMIFDYAHKIMYVKPNKYFKDRFEMNMAGIKIKKMGTGDTVVYHILEDSIASKKGLKKGDVIKTVNGKSIEIYSYLELKKLFEQSGEAVTIQVARDGKNRKFTLTLKRII